MQIRDRIKEFRRVKASDLIPNPKNWRKHPKRQADALRGLLAEVGYADALLARVLPDGKLMLIDGHLRAETTPDMKVPVLILDVTEAEADKILATLDPLAAMAETDSAAVRSLLESVQTDNDAVKELLRKVLEEKPAEIADGGASGETEPSSDSKLGDLEYRLVVQCKDGAAQIELLQRLENDGYNCQVLIS